jgi:hypothetical protein
MKTEHDFPMLQEWISEHELVIGAMDNFSSREEQFNYF